MLVSQNLLSEFILLEMALNKSEKVKGDGFGEGTGWDDPMALMLEEMLLDNMRLVFQSAIEEIAHWGYDEAVVEKAISRRGLFAGSKDPVMSIVNFTLNVLWIGEKFDASMDFEFDNIQHLTEYTLLEMLGVLREIRPFLSVGEAMWWLLICDLNVMQACRLEADSSSGLRRERPSEKNSSESVLSQLKSETQNQRAQTLTFRDFLHRLTPKNPRAPEWTTKEDEKLVSMFRKMEDFWGCYGENGMGKSQAFASRESSRAGSGRKGHSKRELARLMQQRCYIERSCVAHGSKGLLGSGKLASDGGILTDSKLKCSCGSALSLKIEPSKKTAGSGSKAPLANEKCKAYTNTPSTSSGTGKSSKLCDEATTASPPTKPDLKSFVDSTGSRELADYWAKIPYDKSTGKYLPQNKKDELVLKLVLRLQGLQGELQGWTEWANQKVMQAARKLGKVQPELKTMRQLREAAKKFIQERNARRVAILENGVNGINSLVEKGDSIICKLEEENSRMKKELEAAKSKASESSTDYQAALEREQKAKHEIQSWDGEIGLLQKELETEKKKLLALQQDSVKAKNNHNKMEVCLLRYILLSMNGTPLVVCPEYNLT